MHEALTWSIATEPEPSRVGQRVRFGLAAAVWACALTLLAMIVWGESAPGGVSFEAMLITIGLIYLGGTLFVALVIACATSRRLSLALAAPLIVAFWVVAATSADLPIQARFALARPAFEQAVVARSTAGEEAPCPSRIGSYAVDLCQNEGSDVYFFVPGGLLGDVGFAYLPDGAPTGRHGFAESYEPLTGPWYTFSTD